VHKDWGTTGYVINSAKVTDKPTSWKEFWDLTNTKYQGRTMVHDYQLTTIGNALKYFGYSFNSNDEKELAEAEKLLLDSKPNLFAINSDYKPSLINGDAYMSVCWTGDAKQLKKTDPTYEYILGKEGGEIWADFYAVPKGAPHRSAAYALINFLLEPKANALEVEFHGYPVADKRVIDLLPKEIINDPILYPAAELLAPLVKEVNATGLISKAGVAKLSVVGIGMRSHSGVAARLFDCLGKGGINIQLISTSEIKIAVVIDGQDVDRAAQLTHEEFGLAKFMPRFPD
jgi:spermidine/putrescine transport system substrate-binding protein